MSVRGGGGRGEDYEAFNPYERYEDASAFYGSQQMPWDYTSVYSGLSDRSPYNLNAIWGGTQYQQGRVSDFSHIPGQELRANQYAGETRDELWNQYNRLAEQGMAPAKNPDQIALDFYQQNVGGSNMGYGPGVNTIVLNEALRQQFYGQPEVQAAGISYVPNLDRLQQAKEFGDARRRGAETFGVFEQQGQGGNNWLGPLVLAGMSMLGGPLVGAAAGIMRGISEGGDPEEILKNLAINVGASYLPSVLPTEVTGALGSAGTAAATGATRALVTGQDPVQAAVISALGNTAANAIPEGILPKVDYSSFYEQNPNTGPYVWEAPTSEIGGSYTLAGEPEIPNYGVQVPPEINYSGEEFVIPKEIYDQLGVHYPVYESADGSSATVYRTDGTVYDMNPAQYWAHKLGGLDYDTGNIQWNVIDKTPIPLTGGETYTPGEWTDSSSVVARPGETGNQYNKRLLSTGVGLGSGAGGDGVGDLGGERVKNALTYLEGSKTYEDPSKRPYLQPSMIQTGSPIQTAPLFSGLDPALANVLARRGYAVGGAVNEPVDYVYGPEDRYYARHAKRGFHVTGPGTGQSDDIPTMLADGEYVFDSDTVAALGDGSNKAGAAVLDKFREQIREHKRSASVDKIPPKAKSPLEYLKAAKGKKHG